MSEIPFRVAAGLICGLLGGVLAAAFVFVSYLLALGTDALFNTNLVLFALAGALAVVVLMPRSTLEVIIAPLHLRYLEVLIATVVGSVLMTCVLYWWLLADAMTVLWFVTNVHTDPLVLLPLLAIGRAALRLDLLKDPD
jgi:hypothetical protein